MLWMTREATIELNALRETARFLTDQCRQSIETFLEKIKKYEPSLRCGGSSSVMRDTDMKIRWQAAHSNELTQFRGEFHAHNSAVTTLLGTANL